MTALRPNNVSPLVGSLYYSDGLASLSWSCQFHHAYGGSMAVMAGATGLVAGTTLVDGAGGTMTKPVVVGEAAHRACTMAL